MCPPRHHPEARYVPTACPCRPAATATLCASTWEVQIPSAWVPAGCHPPNPEQSPSCTLANPWGHPSSPPRGAATHPCPGARSPSWECENQIWEVPEWGPRNAGSGGEAVGPAGWLGAPEPRLLLRKPPMKEEAGALPIRPLPAAGGEERVREGCPCPPLARSLMHGTLHACARVSFVHTRTPCAITCPVSPQPPRSHPLAAEPGEGHRIPDPQCVSWTHVGRPAHACGSPRCCSPRSSELRGDTNCSLCQDEPWEPGQPWGGGSKAGDTGTAPRGQLSPRPAHGGEWGRATCAHRRVSTCAGKHGTGGQPPP